MRPGFVRLAAASQAMNPADKNAGRLMLKADKSLTPGAGSYTATEKCVVNFALYGAGASGDDLLNTGAAGGGVSYKTISLGRGETLSWFLGTGGAAPSNGAGSAGTASTATWPGGTMTAGAGSGATPGVSTGGDINRTGSAPAGNVGGSAATLSDFAALFASGTSSTGPTVTTQDPGAGGHGNTAGGGSCTRGGNGGIYYVVMEP